MPTELTPALCSHQAGSWLTHSLSSSWLLLRRITLHSTRTTSTTPTGVMLTSTRVHSPLHASFRSMFTSVISRCPSRQKVSLGYHGRVKYEHLRLAKRRRGPLGGRKPSLAPYLLTLLLVLSLLSLAVLEAERYVTPSMRVICKGTENNHINNHQTTMLNILSHRMSGSNIQVKGSFLYNGSSDLSTVSNAYVTQSDILLPT